jgi:hypothetical protein
MPALPPKADMCGATRHFCFGPIADIQACNEVPQFRVSNEHSSAGAVYSHFFHLKNK